MKVEQVNDELIPILKNALEGLCYLENILCGQLNFYKENHTGWLQENDFRPGTFSRLLSSVVASKFSVDQFIQYLEKDNWPDDYRKNYMPSLWKESDYFGHIKEVALIIRFQLIHSIYSQIETTHRLIKRNLDPSKKIKPVSFVNSITKTYSDDEILFFDMIRNTIHNNGFHYPLEEKYNSWSYTFNGKEFRFEIGHWFSIEIEDIIELIRHHIFLTEKTLGHPEIEKLSIIKDIT